MVETTVAGLFSFSPQSFARLAPSAECLSPLANSLAGDSPFRIIAPRWPVLGG